MPEITPDAGSSPAMPAESFGGAFADFSEAVVSETAPVEGQPSTETQDPSDASGAVAQASENTDAPVSAETQQGQQAPAAKPLADENWDNVHPRAKELWEKAKAEETRAQELQQKLDAFGKFGDPEKLNEVLAKRLGYESIDQLEESLAKQEHDKAEAALKVELDAWEKEQADQFGEFAATKMREVEEKNRRLEAKQVTFDERVTSAEARIQQQALKVQQDAVISETLKQVPSDAHSFVRAALSTTATPEQVPAVSQFLIDICRAVENGTKARYGVTVDARNETPTPAGSGGRGAAQVTGTSTYQPGNGMSFDLLERENSAPSARR